MLLADAYLGNVDEDDDLRDRVEREGAPTVTLDEVVRRRSRVRTETDGGTDVGVVVGRELVDGDVLATDDGPLLIELAPITALAIDLDGVETGIDALLAALQTGHVAGNRHWDLAVAGTTAYVPATDDRERMVATVEDALPAGASVTFECVSPSLFDGDVPSPDHSHLQEHADAVRSIDGTGGDEP